MHCHLCENSAIGVCRHCYKFYCSEHGDGFCQTCQQKGWSTGESGALPRAAPVVAVSLPKGETGQVSAVAGGMHANAGGPAQSTPKVSGEAVYVPAKEAATTEEKPAPAAAST